MHVLVIGSESTHSASGRVYILTIPVAGCFGVQLLVVGGVKSLDKWACLQINPSCCRLFRNALAGSGRSQITSESGRVYKLTLPVAGCFGMHVLVVGGVKSFGVLFVELQQLYDVSAKQLGVVHGLASVLMMALGRSLEGSTTQTQTPSCRTTWGALWKGTQT